MRLLAALAAVVAVVALTGCGGGAICPKGQTFHEHLIGMFPAGKGVLMPEYRGGCE